MTNGGGSGGVLHQFRRWLAWRRFFRSSDLTTDEFLGQFGSFWEAHRFAGRYTDRVGCSQSDIDRASTKNYQSGYHSIAMNRLEMISRPGMRIARIGGSQGADYSESRKVVWIDLPLQTRVQPSISIGLARIAVCDALLVRSVMPYLHNAIYDELLDHDARPAHLLLEGFSFTKGRPFVTLQRGNGQFTPYRVENPQHLIGRLSDLGYRLKKEWRSGKRDISIQLTVADKIELGHGMHFEHTGIG